MDAIAPFGFSDEEPITCVEMHTTGEPARIIIKGYPSLSGSLLKQRAEASAKHDYIRARLMLEPAGHADMYGAILRPHTELTKTGDAHVGVLFIHNEGYSTMCGHATIALGRFLLDTHDLEVFPKRNEIKVDPASGTAKINLHAPCGLVRITVPVTPDGSRSDPSRPVSFISVPCFATGANVAIRIPASDRWPELNGREEVKVDFCYGGAFTCLVSTEELGFGRSGLQQPIQLDSINRATRILKDTINGNEAYQKYLQSAENSELSSLYTLIVVDKTVGKPAPGSKGAETGLCFSADQQIDRSPTGSATTARMAHAYAIGALNIGDAWTYHSLVSNAADGRGGFKATIVQEVPELYDNDTMLATPVRVQVEGYAYYVGTHVFIAEKDDPFGRGGFLFNRLGK